MVKCTISTTRFPAFSEGGFPKVTTWYLASFIGLILKKILSENA